MPRWCALFEHGTAYKDPAGASAGDEGPTALSVPQLHVNNITGSTGS